MAAPPRAAWASRCTATDGSRAARRCPRLSGSPASAQAGEPSQQQRRATPPAPSGPAARRGRSARRPRRPGAGWGRGRRRRCPASAKTAGSRLAAPSSAAIFWPGSTSRPPTSTSAGRGPLEQLQRRVEAQHLLDAGRRPASGAGRTPARSIATRPLPKTLTDASWPALSSSTAEATTSSSVSRRRRPGPRPGRETRSSRGSRARRAGPARGPVSANSSAARDRRVDAPPASGATSYIRTIACDHARSCGASSRGTPSSSAITSTGSGSAYSPTTSKPARVHLGEQLPRRARAPAAAAARRGRG